MPDVRDLLDSTTPARADLPAIDYDALARRGARRRLGKRVGAAAFGVAVLVGSLVLVGDPLDGSDLHIADRPDALPPIAEGPGAHSPVDQPDDMMPEHPPAGVWETLPPAPVDTRRDPFVAGLDDGRVVVAGGSLPAQSASPADGAVLSADRTSWTRLPDAPFPDSAVEFTARGSTLWVRTAPSPYDPALAYVTRLAHLDLDAPEKGWEELPTAPIDGIIEPVVTVFDNTVVVFGPTIERATGRSGDVSAAAGAVWRDGTWTAFGAAPTAVTGTFVGVDEEHLAVVGGQVDDEIIADAAILDLDSATWRLADPMPAGPRIHTAPLASAIVVDGRMFVAGGFAEPEVRRPLDEPIPFSSPVPCPDSEDDGDDDGCMVIADGPPGDDPAPDGSTTLGHSSSSSWYPGPSEPATGAAWLDLATGTWEEAELPVDHDVVPTAVRPDPLTAPTSLLLSSRPRSTGAASGWHLDHRGDLVEVPLLGLAFHSTRMVLDDGGDAVLALSTGQVPERQPQRRVAVMNAAGGFVEATIGERLAGVTYTMIDGQLHAFGGIPYQGEPGEYGQLTADPVYDLDAPLLARVLRR